MSATTRYRFGGLTLASEFPLPELECLPTPALAPDLCITRQTLPTTLPLATFRTDGIEVQRDTVLLAIPDVARFLITGGTRIAVDPIGSVPAGDLRLFLLGTAFGIACLQRGLLPLHASTIAAGDHAIAFAGASGAGKSTLGAWLSARGHPLLGDDVCVLEPRGKDPALAHTGCARIKLWNDALDALGITTDGLQRDLSRADKFHLPTEPATGPRGRPLAAIYLLQESGHGLPFVGAKLGALAATTAIATNTYREEFIAPMELGGQHFRNCTAVAGHTAVYPLHRRRDLAAMDAVVDTLEAHWRQLITGP